MTVTANKYIFFFFIKLLRNEPDDTVSEGVKEISAYHIQVSAFSF